MGCWLVALLAVGDCAGVVRVLMSVAAGWWRVAWTARAPVRSRPATRRPTPRLVVGGGRRRSCLVRAHNAPICALPLPGGAARGVRPCGPAVRPPAPWLLDAGWRQRLARARAWCAPTTPVRACCTPTCLPPLAAVLRGAGAAQICCAHLLRGGPHVGVPLTVRARCAPTCSPADSASQPSGRLYYLVVYVLSLKLISLYCYCSPVHNSSLDWFHYAHFSFVVLNFL